MHILVIGWIYVVFMISVVSDSVAAGLARFFFLGVIPVGLWTWMSLRKAKRRSEDAAQNVVTPEDAP